MERKGLSQILYLIIAASVLMMIAMVITFTATDTIGGLGGSATQTQCLDSLQGKCAQPTTYVSIPKAQCISEGQFVQGLPATKYSSPDGTTTSDDASTMSSNTKTYYINCNDL